MNKENQKKIQTKIISIFDKYIPCEYLLFIFGSLVKNKIDRLSDIDLAVYSKDTLPSSLIAQIREELENKVPTLRCIDIVNLTDENISDNLLENILKEGVIWKKPKNSEELLRSLKKRLKSLKR